MKQKAAPQLIGPPAAQDPNLPAEPVTLAPDEILEPVPSVARHPSEIIEWSDDHYYAEHWGIND